MENTQKESNWIENAAYFLREHEILVLNIISDHKIELCIRLANCEFSVCYFCFNFNTTLLGFIFLFNLFYFFKKQYDKLLANMANYYRDNCRMCANVQEKEVYVAYNRQKNVFYRVQIIKLLKTKQVSG